MARFAEMTDEDVATFARESGYIVERRLSDDLAAFVSPMIFNDRLVVSADTYGVLGAWCYNKGGWAERALFEWDYPTATEPEGWKKNALTGEYREGWGHE